MYMHQDSSQVLHVPKAPPSHRGVFPSLSGQRRSSALFVGGQVREEELPHFRPPPSGNPVPRQPFQALEVRDPFVVWWIGRAVAHQAKPLLVEVGQDWRRWRRRGR